MIYKGELYLLGYFTKRFTTSWHLDVVMKLHDVYVSRQAEVVLSLMHNS